MKANLLHTFRTRPLFLLLLPVFFLLHSFIANFAPGVAGTALLQALLYSGIAFLLALLLNFFIKNFNKAALVSFFILSFNFFFGSLHDAAKKLTGKNAFPVRYSFIIMAFLFILICLVIWLRKSKLEFRRVILFLNVLFTVLILFDVVVFFSKTFKKNIYNQPGLPGQFVKCDSCNKPDVYVIIADEYAGQQELKDIFSFDNSNFENDLKLRGFHLVSNTKSNYNATVYSMASLFNMGYIELSAKNRVTQRDMLLCRSIINNNNVGAFFQQQGYTIYNNSFFAFQGKKKPVTNYYFHTKSRILTFETFINRFQKDVLPNHFSAKKRTAVERNDFTNDEMVDSLLRKLVAQKAGGPRFVYTHFTRPHHPYYVDRNGLFVNTANDSLNGFELIKRDYTEHLLYTNKRLLQVIDKILSASATPPVILLAGDHGFRQFSKETDHKYYFMNLCAVHLPNSNYSGFYEGMTPVNTFRVILNSQFGQQLPLLKDSSAFLYEKP